MQRTMTKRASLAAFIASVALLLAFCMPSAAFADDEGVYRDSYNLFDAPANVYHYGQTYEVTNGNMELSSPLPAGEYTVNVPVPDYVPSFSPYFFYVIDGVRYSTFGKSFPFTFTLDNPSSSVQIGYSFNSSDDLFDSLKSFYSGKFYMFNAGDKALPYEEYGKKYFNTSIITKPFTDLGNWCVDNAAKVIPVAAMLMGAAVVAVLIARQYRKAVR